MSRILSCRSALSHLKLSPCCLAAVCTNFLAQYGAKVGGPFGKVMFGGGESDIADLNSALQWVEGELSKAEGPFFLGKDFTLVRGLRLIK